MPQGIVLVVPIAADLVRTPEGIRCGPATKAACDHAVRIADEHPGSYILLTATRAPKYDDVLMRFVMGAYITTEYQGRGYRDREIVTQDADRFNTLGEILAVVAYIKRMREFGVRVTEVVFAVKDWHAKRVETLANKAFELNGLWMPIRIETHEPPDEAPGEWWEKALEPLKTARHLRHLHQLCAA